MYNFCGFFSYKRGAGADDWYEETKCQLEGYLQTALGETSIPMFFDQESIPSGSYWRDHLRTGLDRSPFLIAFFSPAYFNSPWCMHELKTFRERERVLGLRPGTLIHAVAVQGSALFEEDDLTIQAENFHEHYVTHPTFWETTRAAEYSAQLSQFATKVVMTYQNSSLPPHTANFPKLEPPNEPHSGGGSLFAPMGNIVKPFGDQANAG